MTYTFYKYQGTGNDFIIIDNRSLNIDKADTKSVAQLCDRRFGIGADGLILLENHDTVDFKMVYYNADGNESSMCGNGGRCIVHFARFLGIITSEATFEAIDGLHKAVIDLDNVKLQMKDVDGISKQNDDVMLDTGSPHYVTLIEEGLHTMNVEESGAAIRNSDMFKSEGINVNFVEPKSENIFSVRTYERGVEAETLSCGTGVTAVAIAMHNLNLTKSNLVTLNTQGGTLQVKFDFNPNGYTSIWLIGPAKQVFKGEVEW